MLSASAQFGHISHPLPTDAEAAVMPGYFVKISKQIWKTSPKWVIWREKKPNERLVEKLKKAQNQAG